MQLKEFTLNSSTQLKIFTKLAFAMPCFAITAHSASGKARSKESFGKLRSIMEHYDTILSKNPQNIWQIEEKSVPLQPIYAVEARKRESRVGPPRGQTRYKQLNKVMYAIVEINGQQFRVEEGKKLFVHHIADAEAGKTVEFENVLLVDNGTITVGTPTVEGAKVTAEVVSPLVKGDKVLVFHKKRRKGYRKLNGHRQQFTELTIKGINA